MIHINDLYKSFEDNEVLRGVNLTIDKGVTTVIIGSSGSGKSVLLKHIMGLLKPDSGCVYVKGFCVTEMTYENTVRQTVLTMVWVSLHTVAPHQLMVICLTPRSGKTARCRTLKLKADPVFIV